MIQLGNCLDLMPAIKDGSIDMILTDPPFGMDYKAGRHNKWGKIANDNTLDWLPTFFKECYRVASQDSAHYFFCSWHHIGKFIKAAQDAGFIYKNLLIWVKDNHTMGDLKHNFSNKHELIIFCQKGRRKINGSRDSNILQAKKTSNEYHPTQKPVSLLRHLIRKFIKQGGIILDPFAGSGSTAIAALHEGHKYHLIEIDEDNYNTCLDRISKHNNQQTFF